MDRFRNTAQPDWDWWGHLWPTPGETLRRLGVASGTTLAEVACGNGYFALPAARVADPGTVYALDIDQSLLDELAALVGMQGIENVEPLQGDARNLTGNLPEPVDCVLIANTLHGVEDRAGLLAEAYDSLLPGGRLVVVNWADRPRETTTVGGRPRGPPTDLRMSAEETERATLEAADFRCLEHVELPPYHYALGFER